MNEPIAFVIEAYPNPNHPDGGRKQASATRHLDELAQAVLAVVAEAGPLNGSEVARRLREAGVPHQKGEHSKALQQAVNVGALRIEPGPRGAKVYHLNDLPTPTYPDLPQGVPVTYPNPTYKGGVGQGVAEGPTYPKPVTGRTCPCGAPVAAGMVRCHDCLADFKRGAQAP